LYENVVADLDTSVTVAALRIKDSQGVTVAVINGESFWGSLIEPQPPYIVPAGSVMLNRRAGIGADPDRASSQADFVGTQNTTGNRTKCSMLNPR